MDPKMMFISPNERGIWGLGTTHFPAISFDMDDSSRTRGATPALLNRCGGAGWTCVFRNFPMPECQAAQRQGIFAARVRLLARPRSQPSSSHLPRAPEHGPGHTLSDASPRLAISLT